MIRINNVKEKEDFFSKHIKKDGAYFNVKFDNEIDFIWVKKYENWNDDGSDWYLEHSNLLLTYDVNGESLEPYYDKELGEIVKPFHWCYIEGDTGYEIDSYHSGHFLPEIFEIEFVTDDEDEAVKYMVNLESLEEDKQLAAMYGEGIIKSEIDRNNAKVIKDVDELFEED